VHRVRDDAAAARPLLSIVFLGLSITSSWGNGHATTYRGLVRELTRRGHRVSFLERNVPWYAANRDLPKPPYGTTHLYRSVGELKRRFTGLIREADVVIVGSFVPQGIEIGAWVTEIAEGVTAFYDIDTPVTLAKLGRNGAEYLDTALIRRYDLYLSFTGGPVLDELEQRYGARMARPLYCSVDPELYSPAERSRRYALGYMGTYSDDRQPMLERLLCAPARAWPEGRFVVAGPQYPAHIAWPRNVRRIEHLAPNRHRAFYTSQSCVLNITRAAMVEAGWSPSVRLFEAAACGMPIISDCWPGIEAFFTPGKEILLARSAADVLFYLRDMAESERREIGRRALDRVLRSHTATHRAIALETYILEARGRPAAARCARSSRRAATDDRFRAAASSLKI
jgi:spore maturation protein CgeB